MNVGDNGVGASDVEDDDELGQQSCPIIPMSDNILLGQLLFAV